MNSIGDFAENLILGQVEDIKEGKSLPPKLEEAKAASQSAPAKDISQIKVPDDMMRQILGEGFHPQDSPPEKGMPELVWEQPEEEAPEEKPSQLTEETGLELISLLGEVRSMITELKEMTGTTFSGNIGVNLGPPCKDPMKGKTPNSYRKPTKASILRNSIRRRMK